MRKASVIASILVVALAAGSGVGEAPAVSTAAETIAKTWAAREKERKTVVLAWKERFFVPKGKSLSPDQPKTLNPDGITFPKVDTILEQSSAITFVDANWRLEYGCNVVNATNDGYVPFKETISFVENSALNILEETSEQEYPTGKIWSGKNNDMPKVATLWTPFQIFRPITFRLFDAKTYVLSSEKGYVGTTACLILQPREDSSAVGSFWIDPARDYVIRKYQLSEKSSVDIDYEKDEKFGWLPKRWHARNVNSDNRLVYDIVAEVTKCAINTPLAAKDLEFAFPVGTWVNDYRPEEKGREIASYIVKAGGQKRFLTDADREATYKQLLESDGPTRGIARKWKISLVLASIVLVAIVAVIRRRGRQVST